MDQLSGDQSPRRDCFLRGGHPRVQAQARAEAAEAEILHARRIQVPYHACCHGSCLAQRVFVVGWNSLHIEAPAYSQQDAGCCTGSRAAPTMRVGNWVGYMLFGV